MWMAVTNDILELPLAIADNLDEMSDILGVSHRNLWMQFRRNTVSTKAHNGAFYRIVNVNTEEISND